MTCDDPGVENGVEERPDYGRGPGETGPGTAAPTATPVATSPAPDAAPNANGSPDEAVAEIAKALAHPARIAILRTLAARPCICGEIVDVLPLAQSTVSQHLKVLRSAGLISGTIDGPRSCYQLDRAGVSRARSLLGPMLTELERSPGCC